jgi:iron complex transport system permease protein
VIAGSIVSAPRAISRRRGIIWALSALVLLVLAIAGLSLGEAAIPVGDVFTALLGGGDGGTRLIVIGWRFPECCWGLRSARCSHCPVRSSR